MPFSPAEKEGRDGVSGERRFVARKTERRGGWKRVAAWVGVHAHRERGTDGYTLETTMVTREMRACGLTLSAFFSSRFLFCERVTACSAFPPETPSTVGVWETGVISGSNPTGVACGVETSPMTISNLNTLC